MASDFSRRQLLKRAAAIPVVGLGAGAVTASDSPKVIRSGASIDDARHTQVLVVGAGSSGVPAALAAARAGAKVTLLEEDHTPGGAPVDMYVAMICGGPVVGIYAEMITALDRSFRLSTNPAGSFWFMPSAYAEVIARMIRAEKNIQLLCGAPVAEVIVSESSRNRVRGVIVQYADGRRETIGADVVIDATGTGQVAALAGCQCRYGSDAKSDFGEPIGPDKPSDKVQLCTLMLVAQRLRPDAKIDPTKLTGQTCVAENTNALLQWAGTVTCRDTRSSQAVAATQQEVMQKIEKDIAYLYENGYAAHIAPKLGIRECRRVVGDHVLSVNDLIAPKRPDDTVAVGNYPLDSWGDQHGAFEKAKLTYTPGGYGIPLRALLTKNMENLMVVGKCLSATHLAMSAVRVQCIVAQTGQAAGMAAAIAVLNGIPPRSVAIKELQKKLQTGGIPI